MQSRPSVKSLLTAVTLIGLVTVLFGFISVPTEEISTPGPRPKPTTHQPKPVTIPPRPNPVLKQRLEEMKANFSQNLAEHKRLLGIKKNHELPQQ